MNFLKIYRSVKDVFVKPKLKWYFGTWKNEPNMPVWRHGPCIRLSRKYGFTSKQGNYYYPENNVLYFDGYTDNKCYGKIKKYSRSYHKLPGKLTTNTPVWNRRIRKKLRKWHLSWIPPVIYLPNCFTFRFDDGDIGWKTKWDDYRYEWPAHITLVVFGLAISITAVPPQVNGCTSNDDYWESVLNYSDNRNLKETNDIMGRWKSYKTDEPTYTVRFNPEFLKEPYKSQLIEIQNDPNSFKSSIT